MYIHNSLHIYTPTYLCMYVELCIYIYGILVKLLENNWNLWEMKGYLQALKWAFFDPVGLCSLDKI